MDMDDMSVPLEHGCQIQTMAERCFLCDNEFANDEEAWSMFEKRMQHDGQQRYPLSLVLSSALGKELDEEAAHSRFLCLPCNALVAEYESMEQNLYDMRFRIINEYNKTAERNSLSPVNVDVVSLLPTDCGESETSDDFKSLDGFHLDSQESSDDPISRIDKISEVPFEEAAIEEDAELISPMTFNNDKLQSENSSICEDILPLSNNSENIFELLDDAKEKPAAIPLDFASIDEMGKNLIVGFDNDEIIYYEIIEYNAITGKDNKELEQASAEVDDVSEDNKATVVRQYEKQQCARQKQQKEPQEEQHQQQPHSRVLRQLKDSQPLTYDRDGDDYICLLCAKAEKLSPKGFEEHMRKVHSYRFYTCDLCGSGFSRRQALNRHIESEHDHNNECTFECEVCQRVFTNSRLFRIHKRMHYDNPKPYECPECHKKYVSKSLFDSHMNMHTGRRPYKCPQCSKDFTSKYTLQAHLKIHSERPRSFKCDLCEKSFLNQQNLKQHRRLHSTEKLFVCNICSKSFGTQHNLCVHKIVHSGNKPFVCRVCGKAFARRAEIKDHERIHTGERPFRCDMCSMAFTQRSNLTSHKKSTHFNEKQHKCERCDRSFKRRRLLEYHIQSTHTGERPHKCDICNATFVYPEHFKKHMRIHMGIKPYACEVCDKKFISRDNRNAHRFVHSDKKPYECLDCGAGFMRKPLLLAHMKNLRHSNDRIIVNQPQISINAIDKHVNVNVMSSLQPIDECDDDDEQQQCEDDVADGNAITEEISPDHDGDDDGDHDGDHDGDQGGDHDGDHDGVHDVDHDGVHDDNGATVTIMPDQCDLGIMGRTTASYESIIQDTEPYLTCSESNVNTEDIANGSINDDDDDEPLLKAEIDVEEDDEYLHFVELNADGRPLFT